MKNVLFALAFAAIVLPIIVCSGTKRPVKRSSAKTIISETEVSPVDKTEIRNPWKGSF